jgi:hypothetical protein
MYEAVRVCVFVKCRENAAPIEIASESYQFVQGRQGVYWLKCTIKGEASQHGSSSATSGFADDRYGKINWTVL